MSENFHTPIGTFDSRHPNTGGSKNVTLRNRARKLNMSGTGTSAGGEGEETLRIPTGDFTNERSLTPEMVQAFVTKFNDLTFEDLEGFITSEVYDEAFWLVQKVPLREHIMLLEKGTEMTGCTQELQDRFQMELLMF